MTPTQVIALRPAVSGYRLAWARERLQDMFWPIPALLMAGGAVLAAGTVYAPTLGLSGLFPAGPELDNGEAATVLGIIASATLTFLAVVFTITLVALQLASSQASPRVLRTLLRSSITKLAFGLLMATFAYSVAFLVLSAGHRHEPDSRGVTVAVLLVAASLLVFLGYVAATMRLVQVAWVVNDVAHRTRIALRAHHPPAAAYLHAASPDLADDPPGHTERVELTGHRRRAGGVLQGVDHHRLVRLASRHDCVLHLVVRIGQYVPAGAHVITAYGPAPRSRRIMAGLNIGRNRTLYQDPGYGLRQLADIALQALSPAVNQPTTAVQVIDRLEDLLLRIAARPLLTGYYADGAGRVRFVEPVMTWEDCLDLAFTEITCYGAGSPQVVRRLLATFESLEHGLPAGLRPAVSGRRAVLLQQAAQHGVSTPPARPDPLGLG